MQDGTIEMGSSSLPEMLAAEAESGAADSGPIPEGTLEMKADVEVEGTVMLEAESDEEADQGADEGSDDEGAQAPSLAVLKRKKPKDGKVFVLDVEGINLGRSTSNEVVIEGASVSRRHASISFTSGAYVIRDHSSGGGLTVNGERQTEARLSSGDEIVIGTSVFEFECS